MLMPAESSHSVHFNILPGSADANAEWWCGQNEAELPLCENARRLADV
jgi:hypothetical protein